MNKTDDTLELYRIVVETIISNEQRRQQISSVFLTLIAAGFGAVGAIEKLELIYVTVPASIVSAVWWAQVRFLKNLATAKFYVLNKLEEKLSFQPFHEEWLFLKRAKSDDGKNRTWFRLGLSQIEMLVPSFIFIACIIHIGFTAYQYLPGFC